MPQLRSLRCRGSLAAFFLFLLIVPVAGARQATLRPVSANRAAAVFDLRAIPARTLRGATLVSHGRSRHIAVEALRRAIAKRYVRIAWDGAVSVAPAAKRNTATAPARTALKLATTLPDTTITSGPAAGSSSFSTSASFGFSGSGGATSYQCARDGSTWATCTSPKAYTGLTAGTHTFSVRGVSKAGTDPTPATRSWTVLAAYDTTITSAPSGTVNTRSASVAFASAPTGATFVCSLDGSAFAGCASPKSLSNLADGSHTLRVQAIDAANSAHNDPTPAAATWTVSATPPTVTITAAPSGTTNTRTASIAFTAPGATSSQCSLDGGAWNACSSPATFSGLADGQHTVAVRASDAAGNTSAPVSATWTVDATAPAVTITSPTENGVTSASPSVGFNLSEPASARCALDGAADAPCSSPQVYSGLADGSHTVTVSATDSAGNASAPAAVHFSVDTTAPTATITSAPSGTVTSRSATIAFTSSEPGSAQCRIDGGAWAACTSPQTYTSLADGAHTADVRTLDQAGNTSDVVSAAWTVDATAPVTTIDASPGQTNSTTPTFTFSADGPATFECRVDSGSWQACASPFTTPALTAGAHTIGVRATDANGNVESAPPSRTIEIDDYRATVMSTTGLAGFWRLGDAGTIQHDERGLYDGSVLGSPTYGFPGAIAGDANSALGFDGLNAQVQVAGLPALTSDFTVETWVRRDPNGAGDGYVLYRNSSNSGQALYVGPDGTPLFWVGYGSTGSGKVFGSSTLSSGRWHHLVGTVSGGTMRLYVDGAMAGSYSSAGLAAGVTTSPLTIGGVTNTTNGFSGAVDDTAVYTRALTATEVAQHWHDGVQGQGNPYTDPPLANPGTYFGFNDNGVRQGVETADQQSLLSAQAGATADRISLDWANLEPTKGTYNWSYSDGIYHSLLARHIRPLWILLHAPDWASTGVSCAPGITGCTKAPDPSHDADWQRYAAAVAKRYPNSAGIEIFNEPNQRQASVDPVRYTALLKEAYGAIKGVAPQMTVIGPGLGGIGYTDAANGQWTMHDYLDLVYQNGGKDYLDGVSFHPYPCYPCAAPIDAILHPTSYFNGIRSVLSAYNDSDRPLWPDEIGVSSTGWLIGNVVTGLQQSQALLDEYHWVMQQPGVRGMFIHTLVDAPTTDAAHDMESGFGLVKNGTLAPKPAFCAFATERGTGYTCP